MRTKVVIKSDYHTPAFIFLHTKVSFFYHKYLKPKLNTSFNWRYVS